MDILTKIPPQDLYAEQATLGAMLLERDAITTAQALLVPTDFYRETHRILYRAILDLHERREPVDLITLSALLKDRDQLDSTGGTLYLSTLVSQVPTASGIVHYAKIVKDKAVQRATIGFADELMTAACTGDRDLVDLLAESEQKIFALRDSIANHADDIDNHRAGRIIERLFYAAEDMALADHEPETGIISNIHNLNKYISPGYLPGELIILAAYTKVGKSSFTLNNFAVPAAMNGKAVVYFSLEMGSEQIGRRLISGHCPRLPLWALRNQHYLRNNWTVNTSPDRGGPGVAALGSDYAEAAAEFWQKPIWCPPFRAGATPAQLLTYCRRVRAKHGLDLVVIDGLYLLEPNHRRENERVKINQIMLEVKAMGQELAVPILMNHQFSRPKDADDEHLPEPNVFMLRESGGVEQTADSVLLLHRSALTASQGYIQVALQRDGASGVKVPLYWSPVSQTYYAQETGDNYE